MQASTHTPHIHSECALVYNGRHTSCRYTSSRRFPGLILTHCSVRTQTRCAKYHGLSLRDTLTERCAYDCSARRRGPLVPALGAYAECATQSSDKWPRLHRAYRPQRRLHPKAPLTKRSGQHAARSTTFGARYAGKPSRVVAVDRVF